MRVWGFIFALVFVVGCARDNLRDRLVSEGVKPKQEMLEYVRSEILKGVPEEEYKKFVQQYVLDVRLPLKGNVLDLNSLKEKYPFEFDGPVVDLSKIKCSSADECLRNVDEYVKKREYYRQEFMKGNYTEEGLSFVLDENKRGEAVKQSYKACVLGLSEEHCAYVLGLKGDDYVHGFLSYMYHLPFYSYFCFERSFKPACDIFDFYWRLYKKDIIFEAIGS